MATTKWKHYLPSEEAEFRAQRRIHYSTEKEKKQRKKEQEKAFSSKSILDCMETELKTRFITDVHVGSGAGEPSVKALKQFVNFLGTNKSKKNTAGGSRFVKRRENDGMDEEVRLICKITNPVFSISHILKNEKIDYYQLNDIKPYVLDIQNNLANVIRSLMEMPFYQGDSGFMNGAGHNVAFKDVMIQLLVDAQNNVYGDLADRIEQIVSDGKDPFEYRL